jgi:molybdenum cofactor biosynthesis enzyme MoaA
LKSLKLVRILGGEPLLNKEIDKIIEHTLEQAKIKQVYLVTNATVVLSDSVIKALKKYPRKSTVDISNYSANRNLFESVGGSDDGKKTRCRANHRALSIVLCK